MPTDNKNNEKCADANLGIQMELYGNPGTHTRTMEVRAAAFDVLYQCLSKLLYTYLYLMGCSQVLADKILQHSWEQVIEDRKRLADEASKDPHSVRVSIFTLARAKLQKYINALHDTIWDNDDKICLTRAHKQVPRDLRDQYLLRRVGLKIEDISTIRGITPGEVKHNLDTAADIIQHYVLNNCSDARLT